MGSSLRIQSVVVVIIWQCYLNLTDSAIITVKGVDYCYIIHDISKSEAIHLLENSVLEDGHVQKCIS